MGLEAINFFFRSKEQIESAVASNKDIIHSKEGKYVYKKDNNFWIDLEFQDSNSLSIRITLCNPRDTVLIALYHLVSFLFSLKGGTLIDMNTKQVYETYNNEVKEALEKSYLNKKKIFQDIYGEYTAAISSEEFYKRQYEIRDGNMEE